MGGRCPKAGPKILMWVISPPHLEKRNIFMSEDTRILGCIWINRTGYVFISLMPPISHFRLAVFSHNFTLQIQHENVQTKALIWVLFPMKDPKSNKSSCLFLIILFFVMVGKICNKNKIYFVIVGKKVFFFSHQKKQGKDRLQLRCNHALWCKVKPGFRLAAKTLWVNAPLHINPTVILEFADEAVQSRMVTRCVSMEQDSKTNAN